MDFGKNRHKPDGMQSQCKIKGGLARRIPAKKKKGIQHEAHCKMLTPTSGNIHADGCKARRTESYDGTSDDLVLDSGVSIYD